MPLEVITNGATQEILDINWGSKAFVQGVRNEAGNQKKYQQSEIFAHETTPLLTDCHYLIASSRDSS
jgi:hypothetical protein